MLEITTYGKHFGLKGHRSVRCMCRTPVCGCGAADIATAAAVRGQTAIIFAKYHKGKKN